MTIRKVWGSRVNQAQAETFVGQKGTIFFNEPDAGLPTGIRLSDGMTPGGVPISLPPATTATIGGFRVGPGVNVGTGGILTIDTAGLPLNVGDFYFNANEVSTVNTNEDVIVLSNGTGTVKMVGEFGIYATSLNTSTTWQDNIVLSVSRDGYTQIRVPSISPGSVGFLLNGDGVNPPGPSVSGGMLQVVGNTDNASRIYNDSYGMSGGRNVPATWISRAARGSSSVPMPVQAGDKLSRIAANGWNGNGFTLNSAGVAATSIEFYATENFSPTNSGSKITINTVPNGTTEQVESAAFTPSGIVLATTGTSITFPDNTIQRTAFNTMSAVTTLIAGRGITLDNSVGTVTVTLNTSTIVTTATTALRVVESTQTQITTLGTLTSISVNGIISYTTSTGHGTASGFNKSGGNVTLNTRTGKLITAADQMAKGAYALFTVTNSLITTNDVVILNKVESGTPLSYNYWVQVGTGNFQVKIFNDSAGPLSESLIFNFAILKIA